MRQCFVSHIVLLFDYITIFCVVRDSSVPKGVIEENGVKYQFKVYQRTL